jgi:4-amino-4-deoxy-L-arabinose transferase-like glycosyltransferase
MIPTSAENPAATGAPRWYALALVALVAALLFVGLGACPLLDPDEGRYVEIPREMLATGDFVTPRLNGVLYFEKPPLHYWLTAAAIRLLGLDEAAGRFASASLGFAGVLLTSLLARQLVNRRAALLALLALGTSPLWLVLGRLASLDMTLTFFTTATLVSFWFAHHEERRWPRLSMWLGSFAAAALATLTKGLIGIVIPGAVIFLYLLLTWQLRVLLRVPWAAGLAVFALIAVPWHILVAQRNPDFLWFYFVHEHFLRYATPVSDRAEPLWLFPAIVLLGFAPWTGFLPSGLRGIRWRKWREVRTEHSEIVFLLVWLLFVLVFFSISKSKLIPYVLPCMPPLAVLGAIGLDKVVTARRCSRWQRAELVIGVILSSLFGAVLLTAGLGFIDRFNLGGTFNLGLILGGALILSAAIVSVVAILLGYKWVCLVATTTLATLTAVSLLGASLLWAREYSAKEVAEHLAHRLRPNDLVFAYRCFPHSLTAYLDRTVGVADYKGELEFGIGHLSEHERSGRFVSTDELASVWRSPHRVYVVTKPSAGRALAQLGMPGANPIWLGLKLHVYCNQ